MPDIPRSLTSPGPWRDPVLEAQWNEQACFDEMVPDDWDTAECADPPAALAAYEAMARADPGYDESWVYWVSYLCERGAMLAIEQSCHEGVLLPTDQRAVRLASCPEDMLVPARRFFESSPAHVKHLAAYYIYNLVRIERARRTGKADWRPTRGKRAAATRPPPTP